jgi:hypothetical protein
LLLFIDILEEGEILWEEAFATGGVAAAVSEKAALCYLGMTNLNFQCKPMPSECIFYA